MRRLAFIGFAIAAAGACGSTGPTAAADAPKHTIDGSADGHYDFPCGEGSACLLDQVCCSMAGGSASVACTTSGACPTADQIICSGPEDCGGSTPTCCGVDVGDGSGSFPSSCGATSLGASCTATASCSTHLATSCSDTSTVQLCQVKADCGDPNNPECCTFTSDGASITFCTDSSTAGLAGATCHD